MSTEPTPTYPNDGIWKDLTGYDSPPASEQYSADMQAIARAIEILALATIATAGDDAVSSRHTRVVAHHAVMEMLGLDDSRRP